MSGICVEHLNYMSPGKQSRRLLSDISFQLPDGVFLAIVGPSGCGKSTLLRLLAGLNHPTAGSLSVGGYEPADLRLLLPLSVGYIPQSVSFHESLTVYESLMYSLHLRLPASVPRVAKEKWLKDVVLLSGLGPIASQRINTLSGGQRRRLALAEELLGDPQFLLLDEITSGLDPHGDLEMMHWLRDLVRQTGKTIVLVTHSITNIHFADRLLFLKNGKLIYDGCPQSCLASFQAESWEEVYASGEVGQVPLPVRCADDQSEKRRIRSAQAASVTQQLTHLMKRQLVLFRRDSGQCWLHLLLILTFPILVAVFAADGLPQVTNLSLKIETSVISGLTERLAYLKESFKVSSLVAGLSMFQVILLTLMGANNGAREIAKERDVLAKELRAGLSPLAYITTKAMQVTLLSGAQALWMALFVKTICRFPGELSQQFWILFVCTLAMSGACLMISAASRTPEKASLLAIYLVGLQLPLSGAVLALPEWLTSVTRPFIAAYWGWSGYLRTLESFRHYDAVQQSTTTSIAPYSLSWVILVTHFAILSLLAWGVLHRKKSNVAM